MELQHVNIKILAENPGDVDQEHFTPIFHSWIQNQVTGELLLDVADYLHVEAGPGIVLIGNEADYSMDNSNSQLGLRYNRKLSLAGDNTQRFGQALKAALQACQRLESEAKLGGKLRFRRDGWEIFLNDRALAPNTPEARKNLEPEFRAYFEKLLGPGSFALTFNENPRERFGAVLRSSAPLDFEALLKKL